MKNYSYSSHITLQCIQAFSIICIVQSFKTIEQKTYLTHIKTYLDNQTKQQLLLKYFLFEENKRTPQQIISKQHVKNQTVCL